MTDHGSSRYQTVLFDLDHTLLDSVASEAAAFAETVGSVGLEPDDELFRCYAEINRALWKQVEAGQTTPGELRLTRFEQFIAAVGIKADPEELATTFTTGLGNNGELYPGARALLDLLQPGHTLGLVTNGLSEVQRARIERLDLDRYFGAVVISAEVGCAKPGTEIFDITFDRLGDPDPATTLMVGDSLTSDIQGGINHGIDTCWYNPHGTRPSTSMFPIVTPTYEIDALDDLPSVIAAGRSD